MTTQKKATAPSKGAVARSEVNGKPPSEIEFHGLTLQLPKKLPFRVLRYFGSEEPGPREIVGILDSILGREQMEKVWELDIDMEAGSKLIEEVASAMGLDTGESEASPSS